MNTSILVTSNDSTPVPVGALAASLAEDLAGLLANQSECVTTIVAVTPNTSTQWGAFMLPEMAVAKSGSVFLGRSATPLTINSEIMPVAERTVSAAAPLQIRFMPQPDEARGKVNTNISEASGAILTDTNLIPRAVGDAVATTENNDSTPLTRDQMEVALAVMLPLVSALLPSALTVAPQVAEDGTSRTTFTQQNGGVAKGETLTLQLGTPQSIGPLINQSAEQRIKQPEAQSRSQNGEPRIEHRDESRGITDPWATPQKPSDALAKTPQAGDAPQAAPQMILALAIGNSAPVFFALNLQNVAPQVSPDESLPKPLVSPSTPSVIAQNALPTAPQLTAILGRDANQTVENTTGLKGNEAPDSDPVAFTINPQKVVLQVSSDESLPKPLVSPSILSVIAQNALPTASQLKGMLGRTTIQPIENSVAPQVNEASVSVPVVEVVIDLAGGHRVRADLFSEPSVPAGFAPNRVSENQVRTPHAMPEKNAVSALPIIETDDFGNMFGEKKLLNPEIQHLKISKENVGTGSALDERNMTALAKEAPEFAFPEASRIFMAEGMRLVPTEAPVMIDRETASLAGRAVAAVVDVVENQAASRMQPVQSVQLHFKFGGDDLSVQVVVRGGEVQTDFRTENPQLRAALQQEWRVMAQSQPEVALRLAEPTFSAGGGNSGSQAGTWGQQQNFQQHHQQQQARTPQMNEFFGVIARSFAPLPAETITARPSGVHAQLDLPTSQHLSTVA